jgi:hypothetical protein
MPTPTATIFLPYHALDDVILRGTRAAQPAAAAVTPGTLYGLTDEGNAVERSTGTVWQPYSPAAGGGAPSAHHATHETGGTDAITALSGAVLTSGTVPDARLSANVARVDLNNNFVGTANQFAQTMTLTTISNPVDNKTWTLAASTPDGTLKVLGMLDSTAVGVTFTLTRAGVLTAPGGFGTTPLDATQLTAGTVPDARLSSNVPRLAASNVFTGPIQEMGLAVRLRNAVPAANSRLWQAVTKDDGQFGVTALDDAGSPVTAALILSRLGSLMVSGDVTEKNRLTPLGHWTDFTPTLGVSAGALSALVNATCHYTLIGKTCVLGLYLSFTLSAPATVTLALPAGLVSATYSNATIMMGISASVPGTAQTGPGGTIITFYKDTGGTLWAAGSHTLAATVTVAVQ